MATKNAPERRLAAAFRPPSLERLLESLLVDVAAANAAARPSPCFASLHAATRLKVDARRRLFDARRVCDELSARKPLAAATRRAASFNKALNTNRRCRRAAD